MSEAQIENLSLRPCRVEDCGAVFEWRNHPDTRQFFFDPRELSWEEHKNWFANVIADKGRKLLIGGLDGNPVGVLRFDFELPVAVASIYLVPGNSNRGLGSALLHRGVDWLKDRYPELEKVSAYIRDDNIPSLRCFEKAGFDLRAPGREKVVNATLTVSAGHEA